jgi:hypothetical protein
VMKKWRWKGLPPVDWGHNGNLTVAYVMEWLQMFGGLKVSTNDSLRQLQSHCRTLSACQHCCVQHYLWHITKRRS